MYITDKHVSVYMYRHVPMHFIRYLYIYMKEKQEPFMKTLSIYMCACLYHIDLNVNSCSNVSMTFYCCQSRLKCNRTITSLNKLEVDLILWEDFNTNLWELWKQWSLYIMNDLIKMVSSGPWFSLGTLWLLRLFKYTLHPSETQSLNDLWICN